MSLVGEQACKNRPVAQRDKARHKHDIEEVEVQNVFIEMTHYNCYSPTG
jgi:hypothetical protein